MELTFFSEKPAGTGAVPLGEALALGEALPLGGAVPVGEAVPVGAGVVGDCVLGAGVLAAVPDDWVGVGLGVPSSEQPVRASAAASAVTARAVGEVRAMATSLPSTVLAGRTGSRTARPGSPGRTTSARAHPSDTRDSAPPAHRTVGRPPRRAAYSAP